MSRERWGTLKESWNRQVERAEKESLHVIYTKGDKTLRKELSSMARDDPYLDKPARSEIHDVIDRPERAEADRDHVAKHCDLIAGRLRHRREMVEFGGSWDERPVRDRERYEGWRTVTDEAVAAAERVPANRREYGIHLDGMAHRGQSLASALSDGLFADHPVAIAVIHIPAYP